MPIPALRDSSEESEEPTVSADLVSPLYYDAVSSVKDHQVGSTYWKGVSSTPTDLVGSPPPDITLLCLDDDNARRRGGDDDPVAVKAPPVELTITWNMSWSDVLDLLSYRFGRAVYFEYADLEDPSVRVKVADEREFDAFCCEAERRGLRVEVEIKNATMKPSSWIWSPPVPQLTHTSADEVGWDVNTPSADSAYGDLLAPDGGAIQRGKNGGVLPRILRTLADAPRSPEQIAVFGGGGLLLSTGLALYLYMFSQINSVAAVTISLPSNIFFLSLLISEVEEGFGKHHGGRADVINLSTHNVHRTLSY